jgi:integrase
MTFVIESVFSEILTRKWKLWMI